MRDSTARVAMEMLKKGEYLNGDHPLVVLEDYIDGLEEKLRKERIRADGWQDFAEDQLRVAAAKIAALRAGEDESSVPELRDCTCRLGPRLAYRWGDHHDEGCIMRESPVR